VQPAFFLFNDQEELNRAIERFPQLALNPLLKPNKGTRLLPSLSFYVITQTDSESVNRTKVQKRHVSVMALQDVRGVSPLRWIPKMAQWFV